VSTPPSGGSRSGSLLHVIFDDDQKEQELDHILAARNENALIIVSTSLTTAQKKTLLDTGIRAVLLDTPDPGFPFVAVDNRLGGRIAADHLITCNLKSTAFLGDAYRSRQAVEREEAFLERMEEQGSPRPLLKHCHITPEGLDPAIKGLLQELTLPAGIAFHSDLMAYRALELCRQHGLTPGREIHLLGYDDLPQTALLGISTIAQPIQEMGRLAVEYILTGKPERLHRELQPRLILRESSQDLTSRK